jgi:hypothetical protein
MLNASRTLLERDDFWMTPAQLDNPPVRDCSAAPLTLQRADMLSPLEIRAAIKIAERENGSMSEVDAAIAVTRLLGFKRHPVVTPRLASASHCSLVAAPSVGSGHQRSLDCNRGVDVRRLALRVFRLAVANKRASSSVNPRIRTLTDGQVLAGSHGPRKPIAGRGQRTHPLR